MKRIFIVSFLASALAATAQDTTELPSVAVQALRAGPTAPFAKTNISGDSLRKGSLGADLPFLINQTPSVVAASDAGNGIGYTGLRIRGTDATRINITLNGVPFNDAESSGAFLVNLPDFASSVGSLQIQRGVGTSTNGPGAFGASLHLSTTESGQHPYVEASNSAGSFGTLKNTLRLGTGLLGNHFTTDVRLSRIVSNGFVDRASSNLRSYFVSSAYKSKGTLLQFTHFTGAEKTYQAWYGLPENLLTTNRKYNSAGTEKKGEPYENEIDNYQQQHYQLAWTQQLRNQWELNTTFFYVKGKGYYEQYKKDRKYSSNGLSSPIINGVTIDRTDLVRQLWLDNDYWGNIFSIRYHAAETEVTVGGALTDYAGKHFGEVIWAQNGLPQPRHRWYDLKADKRDGNLYLKWTQQLRAGLHLFADAQLRRVDYNIGGFRDNPALIVNNSWTFFNPKMGFTYRRKNYSAFASVAVANKEPNRDDFEAGTTQQPLPERLYDTEVGMQYAGTSLRWGATFYNMQYRNQLVLTGRVNDVGAYTRSNAPDSYRRGVELEAAYKLTPWLEAGGNLTLSQNRIKNFTEFVDDYDNGGQKTFTKGTTAISFSPALISAGTVAITPLKHVSFILLPKYVSKQYLDNSQNENRTLKPYFVQDLRTEYTIKKSWLKEARFTVAVYNVFNKMYEANGYTFSYFLNNQLTTENFYYPMAGRNFMAGLTVRL